MYIYHETDRGSNPVFPIGRRDLSISYDVYIISVSAWLMIKSPSVIIRKKRYTVSVSCYQ